MITPEAGNWVDCEYIRYGKVVEVTHDRTEFKAYFLSVPAVRGKERSVSLTKIIKIVEDSKEIEDLEKRLKGELI